MPFKAKKKINLKSMYAMNEKEIDALFDARMDEFFNYLDKSLRSQSIDFQGKQYKIKKVEEYSQWDINEDKIFNSLNIYLEGYDADVAGDMYGGREGSLAIKKLKETLKTQYGDEYHLDFSESGMQGQRYINLDFSVKTEKVMPEFQSISKAKDNIEDKKFVDDIDKKIKNMSKKASEVFNDLQIGIISLACQSILSIPEAKNREDGLLLIEKKLSDLFRDNPQLFSLMKKSDVDQAAHAVMVAASDVIDNLDDVDMFSMKM